MSGHRSFQTLRATLSPERRTRNDEASKAMLREMSLQELRQARAKSQEDLAATLHVGQPAVAKMEKRADMYVRSLRRYVEALGGTLEITAKFSDAEISINNFSDLETN